MEEGRLVVVCFACRGTCSIKSVLEMKMGKSMMIYEERDWTTKNGSHLFANRCAHHLEKHKHPRDPSIPTRLRDEIEKYTGGHGNPRRSSSPIDFAPTMNRLGLLWKHQDHPPCVVGSIVGGKHVCLSAHALCNLIVPMPERRDVLIDNVPRCNHKPCSRQLSIFCNRSSELSNLLLK